MQCDFPSACTFFQPVGDRKGNCDPDNEHEKWLNKIPEMQTMPFMVVKLISKEVYKSVVGFQEYGIKFSGLSGQQEHCKSPEEVN